MEAPGSSIFAGATSLHIDRSAQERLEEQEDLEDRQRRAVELKANLDNAFDDFADDDEPSSVNSSHDQPSLGVLRLQSSTPLTGAAQTRNRNPPTYIESFKHLKDTAAYEAANQVHEAAQIPSHGYQHYEAADERRSPCGAGDAQDNCFYPNEYRGHLMGQQNGVNAYEAKQKELNYESLKIMYNMRVAECQQMASQLVELQRSTEMETDSLRARLATALSDADQVRLSLQQAQHQLATSKHQMVELQQQMSEQKEAGSLAAADKERVAQELHATALALQEAQQRLQTLKLERNHNTDVLFREQQDRHREECERLREDLERTKNRLEEKEKEASVLERRRRESERAREEALVERGALVNRLAAELEAAHARPAAAVLQLKELGTKLEQTAAELVASRQEATRARRELDEWRAQLRRLLQDAALDQPSPGNSQSSPGKLATLKEVLSRYKQQEHQINKLTDEINRKDNQLESCRQMECELKLKLEKRNEAEGRLQSQVETLQAQLKTVELNYAELELKHGRLQSEGSKVSPERVTEADRLRSAELTRQLQESVRESGELKSLYLQACSARDALSRELKDIGSKLSSLQKEREAWREREKAGAEQAERERRQAEQLSSELESERSELEQARRRVVDQQKEYASKQKEFTNQLNKYIKEESEPCAQCAALTRSTVAMQEQLQQYKAKLEEQAGNEILLHELRGKAEYFQQYIAQRYEKLRDQRDATTNTDGASDGHRRRPDGRDRPDSPEGEIADRDNDDSFASRTDMMIKEKHIREQLAQQYTLEIKTLEMNCTKRINELQKENSATISKLKELLERKAQEVEVLKKFVVSERAKITEMLQAKEKDIAVVIQENRALQHEYRQLREKSDEWRRALERGAAERAGAAARLHALEAQHDQLREKYRAVKKTALVYKEYASKKDAHVETELERIKSHYEAEVARLHDKLQRVVKKRRDIQVNERISKMQSDFDAMVSEVHSIS